MKNLLLLLFLFIPTLANATKIVYTTTWAPTGTVTSTNLNGNFANVSNIVNGSLDNTNANTAAGFYFYKSVATLPTAGTQGACYFYTGDNTFDCDNGTSYIKLVAFPSATPVQGDILYYNGTNWVRLAAGANGTKLTSNGAGTNPSWQ